MNSNGSLDHSKSNFSIPDTLWSATLLDMLVDALRYEYTDEKVRPLVNGLFYKQFSSRYIFARIRAELGDAACERLKEILVGN
jgi:hypothetical protein